MQFIQRTLRTLAAGCMWALALASVLTFSILPAQAISGSTNISVQNGAISLTGTVPIANGGTNNGSLSVTNGLVPYMDGSKMATTSGVGSNGQCLKSVGGGQPGWANCATSDTNTIPVIGFGTGMTLAANNTVYVWPGAPDPTESNVKAPQTNAATYANITCQSSAAPGGSDTYTVTFGTVAPSGSPSVCGALVYTSQATCQISASNRICAGSGTTTVNAGDCVGIKIVSSATAASAFVNCTAERTS